mmetsp:Transcript_144620/g.269544  ORF Transcript_144620/g.269544 Transcript_144620/m.269544 type:complete len:200 (-) Transcript_144620:280-879(-)
MCKSQCPRKHGRRLLGLLSELQKLRLVASRLEQDQLQQPLPRQRRFHLASVPAQHPNPQSRQSHPRAAHLALEPRHLQELVWVDSDLEPNQLQGHHQCQRHLFSALAPLQVPQLHRQHRRKSGLAVLHLDQEQRGSPSHQLPQLPLQKKNLYPLFLIFHTLTCPLVTSLCMEAESVISSVLAIVSARGRSQLSCVGFLA